MSLRFGWNDADVLGAHDRKTIQILGAPCRSMAVLNLLHEALNAASVLRCVA